MDVYVARQPIFDTHRHLYGYELLYRKSQNNFYEGTDDEISTASVLFNSFLVIDFNDLIDNTRGFINFSEDFLTKDIPSLLPKEKIVIEVLERVEATPEVIQACRTLKEKGYTLALDDFILEENGGGCAALIEFADIIKIEFPLTDISEQKRFLHKYKKQITFLAERIETVEEYNLAVKMGYSLFQGYFFSKPIMVNGVDISSLNTNLLFIINELKKEDPDIAEIASIIQRDVGLSYKLLKMSNSVHYGAVYPIKSITQALARLGTIKLLQWSHLMLLHDMKTPENCELVKTCVIRGRILSLTAYELGQEDRESDYFIAGLFSSLDAILNENMENILKNLPIEEDIKRALLGETSDLRSALDSVLAFEKGIWDQTDDFINRHNLTEGKYTEMYFDALKWQNSISM